MGGGGLHKIQGALQVRWAGIWVEGSEMVVLCVNCDGILILHHVAQKTEGSLTNLMFETIPLVMEKVDIQGALLEGSSMGRQNQCNLHPRF